MVRLVRTLVSVLCGLFAVVLVGLFTPDNEKFQILLTNGFAAIVWMASGAVVTTLTRRFALPNPRELMR